MFEVLDRDKANALFGSEERAMHHERGSIVHMAIILLDPVK